MKRDFSSASRQNLLNAISSVEGSQDGNFTDWSGTSRFNINYYIRQVNGYHFKVISKNNETKRKINNAFDKAISMDKNISTEIRSWYDVAERWKHYIEQLNIIVSPGKGNFTSTYMVGTLNNLLNAIENDRIDRIRQYAIGEVNILGEYESILLEEFLDKTPYEMSEAEMALLSEIMTDSTWAKVYLSRHVTSNVVVDKGNSSIMFDYLLKKFDQMIFDQHIDIVEEGKWTRDGISVTKEIVFEELADILKKDNYDKVNSEYIDIWKNITGAIKAVSKGTDNDKIGMVGSFSALLLNIVKARDTDSNQTVLGRTQTVLDIFGGGINCVTGGLKMFGLRDDASSIGIIGSGIGIYSELSKASERTVGEQLKESGKLISGGSGLGQGIFGVSSSGKKIEDFRVSMTKEQRKTAKQVDKNNVAAVSAGLSMSTTFLGDIIEKSSDGQFDINDYGATLLDTGINGATSLLSSYTYGAINIDPNRAGEIYGMAITKTQDIINETGAPVPLKIVMAIPGTVIAAAVGTVGTVIDFGMDIGNKLNNVIWKDKN